MEDQKRSKNVHFSKMTAENLQTLAAQGGMVAIGDKLYEVKVQANGQRTFQVKYKDKVENNPENIPRLRKMRNAMGPKTSKHMRNRASSTMKAISKSGAAMRQKARNLYHASPNVSGRLYRYGPVIKEQLGKAYQASPNVSGRLYRSGPVIKEQLRKAYQASPNVSGRIYRSGPVIKEQLGKGMSLLQQGIKHNGKPSVAGRVLQRTGEAALSVAQKEMRNATELGSEALEQRRKEFQKLKNTTSRVSTIQPWIVQGESQQKRNEYARVFRPKKYDKP